MRKITFLFLATCLLNTVNGQTKQNGTKTATAEPAYSGTVMSLTNDIPDIVVKRFKEDYPAYKPVWSREGYNYRADYIDAANMQGMVVYNRIGRIIRSETELQANSYPGAIGDYHTSHLPRRTYRVYSTKDTTGNKGYYSTTEDEMLMFDQEGNYKSRTKRELAPSKEVR